MTRNLLRYESKEIDYKSLIYNFTTKYSGSINFIKFIGPFSLFKELKNRNISLEKSEKDQEKFKREFGQIKSGNPKHKSEMQLYIIKKYKKSLYDLRQKLLIYLMITQKLNLNLFIDQITMKLREQDLKC